MLSMSSVVRGELKFLRDRNFVNSKPKRNGIERRKEGRVRYYYSDGKERNIYFFLFYSVVRQE